MSGAGGEERLQRIKSKTQIHPVDRVEMQSLLGILYLIGLVVPKGWRKPRIWSEAGHYLVRAAMGRDRFQFLWYCLRFDDSRTTEERKKKDRFAKIRSLFQDVIKNFSKARYPDEHLGIDEVTLTWTGTGTCQ